MATDAVRYRRQNREASARAAKEKREKIVLVVGFALLLGVGAFEGPKMIKRFSGSSSPAPSTAVAPATPAAPAAPKAVDLKSLSRFAAKDPFIPQITQGAAGPKVTLATPPAVRTSHFVRKDPFVPQLTVTSAATAAPAAGGKTTGGSKTPAVAAGVGPYIVVVASVPVGAGKREAQHEAAVARAHGIASVKIVVSADYPTLREGYFAVFSGPFSTLAKAREALGSIRGQGYVSAYTRRLGH